MDPLYEQTTRQEKVARQHRRTTLKKMERRARKQSSFEQWAWTEIPAYRLGLLLSYSFSVYFGISALIAGIPIFEIGAPTGWTTFQAIAILIAGPLGVLGIVQDTLWFRRVELAAATILSLAVFSYAATMLYIAYATEDMGRVSNGAALMWLATGPIVRMFWLIAQEVAHQQTNHRGGNSDV